MLALFGLGVDPAKACRQALRAASLVASNIAYLNHQFATDVREPIQRGIDVHAGEVIVGDIGFRGHTYSRRCATRSMSPRGCRT
jgi:adenylate cyclase